jgi:YidC/Oxa1 family membrane protein insertase
MSLLLLWDNWMRHTGRPSMFFPTATQTAPVAAPASAPVAARSDVPQAGATPASTTTPGSTGVAGTPAPAAARTEIVTITTDVVKVDIDSRGGEIKRLELLQHKDTLDPTKNVVLFESSAAHTYLGQSGLTGGTYPNHQSVFTVLPGARSLDAGNQVQLVMEATQGDVKLTKTFVFKRGDYTIDIKNAVTNLGTAAVTPSLYAQLLRDDSKLPGDSKFYSTFTGPAIYTETDKFQKFSFEDIEKNKATHAVKSNNGWISMVQHYFVSAYLFPDQVQRDIFSKKIDSHLYAVGSILPLGTIAPGATAVMDTRLYSGPQESAVLEKLAPGLDLVKDYGWLTIVAKPIFWLMTLIHSVLGNWGFTIIVLTMIIKLVFFPLSAASYRSMAKMKVVTPKMTAIRERHKGDTAKMNQAMMELYKTEKINPLGGCLPIVVQIPVFIALYWVLLASVEMRNAPWIGWIHDLASPDPYFILPVLMAVSMFIQTKLNPKPPDPIQAKVMMFMPLAFSVMFFFFPSGLVLYWVVNNVLSIAQQWVITRRIEGKKLA